MSTELESNTRFHLNRYYGGDDQGYKLQITHPPEDGLYAVEQNLIGAIQLTAQEALDLIPDLLEFATREAERRQELLRKQIANQEIYKKTVFAEVAELKVRKYQVERDSISFVFKFAPICEERIYEGKE